VTFPADFVWGAATAAHQVEGGNWNSDCWALENAKPSFFIEPSGVACDQFARYNDDLAILAGLGLNTYRFSIEWARVEPEEGAFSQQILDHYKRVIDACWTRNIQPMATFHHFTNHAGSRVMAAGRMSAFPNALRAIAKPWRRRSAINSPLPAPSTRSTCRTRSKN
jgi:beta-glucosidase/6-phospho-beta-glucosidase/beta-galactosidase